MIKYLALCGMIVSGPVALMGPLGFASKLNVAATAWSCVGCSAEPTSDPDTGYNNGVNIIYVAQGMSLGPHGITGSSAKCSGPLCLPEDNCAFTITYTVMGIDDIGVFHDSAVPCNWSQTAGPFGEQTLTGGASWIAACDDLDKWWFLEVFNNATPTDCSTGTMVLQVEFRAKCTSCRG